METERIKLSQVSANDSNPRTITEVKFAKLVNNILTLYKMLDLRPVVVTDELVALGGNMRLRALQHIASMDAGELDRLLATIPDYNKATDGEREAIAAYWHEWQANPVVPVAKASTLTPAEQRRFIILDNVGFGDWDWDELANSWDGEELADWGLDNWGGSDSWADAGNGDDGDGAGASDDVQHGALTERFVAPPFTVLDTRQGYWRDRKQMWRELISDAGETREGVLAEDSIMTQINNGTSLFDPVVAEIICKWFTPHAGSLIFDCFAGDTQKGFVFGTCGHKFTGIELRQEQIDVNNKVLARFPEIDVRYICDDGQNVAQHFGEASQDLLMSCPPYYDLEVYSDNPNDASNQATYSDFIKILENAYSAAITRLKENRFAVIVVGDIRDKNGFYYDFISDVKRIFRNNGMQLYNEMILVEAIGTLPQRVSRSMRNRKLGKCHQNILVFYKGDPKLIQNDFTEIQYTDEDIEVFTEENAEQPTTPQEAELNALMKELNNFRAGYIKQSLISYEPYPKIKDALSAGDIHIKRDEETNEIIGYLWMQDLKKKPLSRIYEICSSRKGLGRELVELALSVKKNPVLQLWVVDYNENAIGFYKHMGFVEVERETGKKINNITMEYAND